MAAVIATERPLQMRMPGRELVVQNVVNWRTVHGYGRQWRGSSDWHWSPEQISGWLKRAYPEDERYHVSHETIYRSLFVQARGVLKKELLSHLRSKRTMRRSKPIDLRMAIDGGISRISSHSDSDRPRLRIGRCPVIGRAICCPGRTTATSRPWSSVIRVT